MRLKSNPGSMTTSFNNHGFRKTREWLGAAPSLLIFVILILYPVLALLVQTFLPHMFGVHMSLQPSLAPIREVFTNPLNFVAVLNSLELGLAAAVLATVFGTICAFGSVRASRFWRVLIDTGVWIVFFAPSYVIAQGWLGLMQDGGIAAELFHLPNGWSAWFFTKYGLAVTMGLRYIPFVYFAMTQAIVNIGTEFEQAGRLLGASRKLLFRRITLPLMTPALLAGASLAFAEGFGDFGFAAAITPSTHIPMITYQIYALLDQTPVDYPGAAGLSLIMILVMGAAFWLQMRWVKRRSYSTVSSHSRTKVTHEPRRFSAAVLAALAILVVALVLPLGSTVLESLLKSSATGLGPGSWTFHHYQQVLNLGNSGVGSLRRTFIYSVITGLLTMVFGLYLAFQMMFKKTVAIRAINTIMIATIAIPGIVLAAGFIFAYNAVWLIPVHLVIYGTPLCLGMAYLAGTLPFAIRLQLGAMNQMSPNLTTAAASLGAKQGTILRRVVLPLVRGTAVSTFFMALTGTMFELPASSLLYPAGYPPFPEVIQQKFNAFEYARGSALTLIGMFIVFAMYAIGRLLEWRLSKGSQSGTRETAPEPVVQSRTESVVPSSADSMTIATSPQA
ncbi:ABC transporter permease [Alicyclobacillus mengziensis]|uniref:Iron ABC transporter permease n=1 Tax=Alicyclobacillus mengziensis TaxID=2931921 RepID=A0A9X7W0I0_9BACL|nr:iron ABC transporter permease [Alicyclobacillus mengziensis]QSO48074.1 iron ABC transporter permease [Alicyclobacillus mengziensis]